MNIQMIKHQQNNQKPTWMRDFLRSLLALSLLAVAQLVVGEGTQQVAPGAQNIVMLEINRDSFGNFAAAGGPEESRLYFTIEDNAEQVFLGFSQEYNRAGLPLSQPNGPPTAQIGENYYFQIRYDDPNSSNDTIVYGPIQVDRNTANINNWTESLFENYKEEAFFFQPTNTGDYYVEFIDLLPNVDGNDEILIGFWDITVAQNEVPIDGRVWSRNWAFRTPQEGLGDPIVCEWNREFQGTLYSYTSDQFVSKIDFSDSGFQGLSFNVAFNSKGPGDSDDITESRKSIPGVNATGGSAAEHQVFLNPPDEMVFPSGECGEITASTIFNCQTDSTFCLEVAVTLPGLVNVILDFNRNGVFDPNSEDTILAYNFTDGDLATCIEWDGVKSNGELVAFGDTVNIIFIYSQGVQNWAVYDGEILSKGFCVESVRPTCNNTLNTDLLYWDDTNLSDLPGTGQPLDGRAGVQCRVDGARTWTNFSTNVEACRQVQDPLTTGYGDKTTLNTWWFANIIQQVEVNVPLLTCQVVGDDTICLGDTTTLTVEVSGTSSSFSYLWSGPEMDGATTESIAVTQAGTYCATVVDEEGCQTECCIDVIVNTPPTLTGSANAATCFSADDGTITLIGGGGTGALSYSIDGTTFQSSGLFENISPGDYTGIVRDENGCTASIAITVGELLDDTVNYQEEYTICLGSSVELTPSEALPYSYEWMPATGLDNPAIANPVASPDATTTYTVTITIIGNDTCQYTQEVTVNVLPGPGLSVSGDGNICTQNTTLEASSTADNVSFAWTTPTGDTLQLGPTYEVTVQDEANFLLRGLDADGCEEELPISVVFDPVVVELPDTLALCLGEEFSISPNNLDASDTLTYSWSPTSAFVSGTDTASPDVLETIGETQVFVSITNQHGCSTMDSILLAVVDPNINLNFSNELACDGTTVDFTNLSTNAFAYLWEFGDGSTSTEVSPSYTYSAPGTYTVTLSSLYDVSCAGDKVTQEVTITDPLVVADFDFDIISCGLDTIIVQFTDNSTNTFNNALTYNWTFSNGEISTEANPQISLTTAGPLTVDLTITTANDCSNSTSETLTFEFIEFNVADTLVRCPDEELELNPGGNTTYTYAWSPAAGLSATNIANPTATPSQTTTYTVTIENISADTCSYTQEITVIVPDAIGLDAGADQATCGEALTLNASVNPGVALDATVWTNLNGDFLGNGLSIEVNPEVQESYIITATDQVGCTESDTVVVTNNQVNVSMPDDIISCTPFMGALSITNLDPSDILTYSWTPLANILSGADTATPTVEVLSGTVTFTVVVSNQFGCSTTETIDLTAGVVDIGLPDTLVVCEGATAPLNPGGSPSFTYTWSPADGLDDATSNNPTFIGSENTLYTVTVADNSTGTLCEIVDSIAVVVGSITNLTITQDTTICEEGPFNLANLAAGFSDVSWFEDAQLTTEIGTGDNVIVDLVAGNFEFYGAILSNEACSDTVLVNVEVVNFDTGLDDFTDLQVCAGFPTPINPNGNPDYTYTWSPTDALDLTEPWNPIVETFANRTYNVTVVDNTTGCTQEATVNIDAVDEAGIVLPNDTAVCFIGAYELTATTNVLAPINWYDNPTFTPPAIASGNTVSVTLVEGANTFWAIAGEGTGCADTSSVTITATDFQAGIADTTINVCLGLATPIFTPVNPSYTYQWTPLDGLELNGEGQLEVTALVMQTYDITVTDPASGCTDEFEVAIVPVDDAMIQLSNDTTVCFTGSFTLEASTSVFAPVTWYDNASFTAPALGVGNSIEVNLVEGENTFWAIAGEGAGCADTSSVTITAIDFNPGIADTTINVCLGLATPIFTPVNPSYTYVWSPLEGLELNGEGQLEVTALVEQTYMITVTDNNSACTDEFEVTIVPVDDAMIELPNDTSVCFVGDYTLSAMTAVFAPVTWYDNAAFTPPALGTGETIQVTLVEGANTFWAIAGEGTGCADTSSVTITATDFQPGLEADTVKVCAGFPTPINPNGNPNYTYTWSPTDGLDLTNPWNPIVTALDDIEYSVTVVDPASGCDLETDIYIDAVDEAGLQLPNDTTVCFIGDYTLTATTMVDAPINWYADESFDPVLGTGNTIVVDLMEGENTFWAIAGEEFGCADTSMVTITSIDFDSGLNDTTINVCLGLATPIFTEVNPNYTYDWTPLDGLELNEEGQLEVTALVEQTYMITVTDNNSECTDEFEVTIVPVDDAMIELPNDTSVCFVGDYTLSATTAVFAPVTWYDNATFTPPALGTGETIQVTLVEGTNTFWAIAGEGAGCADTSSVTITATDFQPGLESDTVKVCAGFPTPINPNGNPNYTYTWSPTDGLDLTNPWNPVVTTLDDIEYSVTVVDPVSGCDLETDVYVDAVDEAGLQLSNDTTVCFIGDYTLTATTMVSAPINWYADENFDPVLGTGNTIVVDLIEGENTFWAIAGEDFGCADTAMVTITAVDFQPVLSDTTINVCAGFPTPIFVDADPAFTYEWSPLTGIELVDGQLVVDISSDQTYNISVTDPASSCTDDFEISINAIDEAGIELPNDTAVCFVGAFELSAMTEVIADVNWYANENFDPLLGTGNTIEVTLVEGANTFWAIAGEGTGCADTAMVTITATDFQPGLEDLELNICANTLTPINPNGNPNYTYVWSPTDGLVFGDPWNPSIDTDTDQVYSVTVTDPASGCELMTMVNVTVITPIIELMVSDDMTVCDTMPLTLTATATGDQVTLTWYDNLELMEPSIGTGNTIEATPVFGENVYVVQAEDSFGCEATRIVRVTAINVNSGIPSNLTVCEGDAVPLNPNGNPDLVYSWSPPEFFDDPSVANPVVILSEDVTFTIMVSDSTGVCQKDETLVIEVLPTIGLEASADTVLCMLDEVELTASTNVEDVDLEWFTDLDGPSIGTGPSLTQTPMADEVYYIVASYDGTCPEIDSVRVLVSALDVIITPIQLFCEPVDEVELMVQNLDPSQMLSYEWAPSNAILSGSNTTPMVTVNPNIASEFSVTVTNEDECSEVLTTTAKVSDLVSGLTISAEPDTILLGEESQLLIEGCATCTYDWSPSGDLDAFDVFDPVALPTEAGTITYTVVVTEDVGGEVCTQTFTQDLFVRNILCTDEGIFLPDAFTPNGDDSNDILVVRSNNITEIEFMIYNRWGERMFRTTTLGEGWDGTFKGELLPPDVYGFYLRAICPNGEEFIKQGNVTLLR
ncbi:MAG: PKD domain-containing protein [Bacteroidota bacterium]